MRQICVRSVPLSSGPLQGRVRIRTVAFESPTEVARRLLRYLSNRLELKVLEYAHEPTLVTDGWETFIYHFELARTPTLPSEFVGPLTLRLYPGPAAIARGRRAYAIKCYLQSIAYPVPAPICWEESCEILGGPFLIMEQIPGPTMLRRMLSQPWNAVSVLRRMVELQIELHKLPADGLPHPAGEFLERSFHEIQELIDEYGLQALLPALEWLRTHRPDSPRRSCILHLDFHPLNVIFRKGQPSAVLDWDAADVGDPHADIASTLMLMRCAPRVTRTPSDQFLMSSCKGLIENLYLFACWRRMSLDRKKLDFYRAWASVRRLSRCGQWLAGGPQAAGAKPSLICLLQRDHLDDLCAYFTRRTGVNIRLDGDTWQPKPA